MAERKVLDLVSGIYEAAMRPELWPGGLTKLSDAMRGEGTVLVFHRFPGLRANVNAHVRMDPAAISLYERQYSKIDFRVERSHKKRASFPAGCVFLAPPELITEAELVSSQIYNEFLQSQGMHHSIVGVIHRSSSSVSAITCTRRRAKRPFSETEVSFLKQLMPHFQRALRLHGYLAELTSRAEAAENALDRWQVGWVLVDVEARILSLNRAGKAILDCRDGLETRQGRVSAYRAGDTHQLRLAIRSASRQKSPEARMGQSIAIQRRSSQRPLSILVAPFNIEDIFPQHNNATAMLFVADPDRQARPSQQSLCQLYGLTPAEFNVAVQLASGEDLRTASETLGITKNTARGYLKLIFQKTSVKRQSELVRLLLLHQNQLDPPFEG